MAKDRLWYIRSLIESDTPLIASQVRELLDSLGLADIDVDAVAMMQAGDSRGYFLTPRFASLLAERGIEHPCEAADHVASRNAKWARERVSSGERMSWPEGQAFLEITGLYGAGVALEDVTFPGIPDGYVVDIPRFDAQVKLHGLQDHPTKIVGAATEDRMRALLAADAQLTLPQVWWILSAVGRDDSPVEAIAELRDGRYHVDHARLSTLLNGQPIPSVRATPGTLSRRIDGVISVRAMAAAPATFDDETLSVEGIIATETPVPMYDYERGAVVDEVLLADGVELPSRGQVPLLNAHSRANVSSVMGSVREIQSAREQVLGRVYFASSEANAYELVREGHVTDLSAGYSVLERTHVARGTTETIAGRRFTGPVNVVTSWRLKEVSLVPIGADEAAKVREAVA